VRRVPALNQVVGRRRFSPWLAAGLLFGYHCRSGIPPSHPCRYPDRGLRRRSADPEGAFWSRQGGLPAAFPCRRVAIFTWAFMTRNYEIQDSGGF
jgi:hypothetical protein